MFRALLGIAGILTVIILWSQLPTPWGYAGERGLNARACVGLAMLTGGPAGYLLLTFVTCLQPHFMSSRALAFMLCSGVVGAFASTWLIFIGTGEAGIVYTLLVGLWMLNAFILIVVRMGVRRTMRIANSDAAESAAVRPEN